MAFSGLSVKAQLVAFGTSVFVPVDAPMAVAVPPISLRGSLFEWKFMRFESGITWYRMGGLSVLDSEYPFHESITQPFNSFVVPLQLGAHLSINDSWSIQPKIGAFYAINSTYKVNQDNLGRAILLFGNEYKAISTQAQIEQSNTFGFLGGIFATLALNEAWSFSFGGSWYEGSSRAAIQGPFDAISLNDVAVKGVVDLPNSVLDYRGFEIAVSVQFKLENEDDVKR
jgi:hypothetical protein